MNSFLQNAKTFAALSTDRNVQAQVESSTGANVKFFSAQTSSYAALFAIVTLGSGPNALQLVNIFGKFDHNVVGGSINVPPEILSGVSAPVNPLMRQFTAYKEDAPGKAYFGQTGDSAPPPCEKYNYSFMILGDGSGSFGVKSSSWKTGDADVYSFRISDLTPLEPENILDQEMWCKDPLPVAAGSLQRASTNNSMWIALITVIVVLALIAAAMLYAQRKRKL